VRSVDLSTSVDDIVRHCCTRTHTVHV